jgi:PIN domain nuclease of toxin-antitoxin system
VKILIDAQCFLWWFTEPDRLSAATIAAISDETNSIWFSVASVCELTIKVSLGTLSLPEPIDSYLASRMKKLRAQFLDIRADQVLQLGTLPLVREASALPNRFDLILLAQARVEGMTLITANHALADDGVEILLNDSDEGDTSRISVSQRARSGLASGKSLN